MSSVPNRTGELLLTLGAVFLSFLAVPTDAQAYLDPATGSAVIQMVVAGALGALFVIKTYWHKLKSFFSRAADDDGAPTIPDSSAAGDDDE